MSRRLGTVETRVDKSANKARGAADPIAAEIGELGTLVRQIAETVASHAALLAAAGRIAGPATTPLDGHRSTARSRSSESDAVGGPPRFARSAARASPI